MTGFESGAAPLSGWDSNNGSAMQSADSSVVRSGNYSFKLAKAGTGSGYIRRNYSGQTVVVARFALRFASLPTADVSQLVQVAPIGGYNLYFGFDQATSKLEMVLGSSGQSALSANAVSADMWYRVEFRFNVGVTPRAIEWKINGTSQTTVSAANATSTLDKFYLGSGVTADVFTAYYDDVLLSTTSGDYPLGDGRIRALTPDAVSAVNDPAGSKVQDDASANVTVATPGAASRMDETPMTATSDFIKHIGTNAASYAELSFANTARNACINAVSTVVAQHGSNATGGIGATYVYDGGTQRTVAASATISGTSIAYKMAAIAPATGTWNATKLNALVARVGYSSNATGTNYPAWDALLLEYDTTPNPAVTYETSVLADGPSGYWRLGETSGTTASALTGTTNGTYTGSPALGVSSLVGDTDTATYFDGTDDYVDLGDTYDFAGSSQFTVECWLNPTAPTAQYRRFVTKERYVNSSNRGGWYVSLASTVDGTPNRVVFGRFDGGAGNGIVFAATPLQAGRWYHIAATYDGTTMRVYLNGVQDGTTASSLSVEDHTIPLTFGRRQGTDYYSGMLDEVALYPSALSQTRIQAHYDAGRL
jgi:hypothetical protein